MAVHHKSTSIKEKNLALRREAAIKSAAALTFVLMAERGQIDEVTATEYMLLFEAWSYPIDYAVGQIRQYNGKLYKCVQAHTSQENWTPETSASLWSLTGDPGEEWTEWSQPIGAHNAYEKGAKVSHRDKRWMSDVDDNVWEPGVYGWSEVTA